MTITDTGRNDPIDFVLGEIYTAIARLSREAIEANRLRQNERDARQKMLSQLRAETGMKA